MPPNMRIAYVDQTSEMGGAEHLLLTLLDGLPRETTAPLLICAQDGPFPTKARQRNIPTSVIPLPKFHSLSLVVKRQKFFNPVTALWDLISILRSAWRIKRFLKASRIDLVQTNSAFAHLYGGLAARLAGVPCVWYFHDLVEKRRLVGSIALFWRICAACLAARVVGVSEAVIQSLAVGSKGRVIYAGYKEQVVKDNGRPDIHTQLALPDDAKLVGYIGRIAYVKALDVLAQAARQVVQAYPQVHFVFFGEALFGQTDYKRALEKTIGEMQLNNHWHWLGYDSLAAARIPDLDFLVLPSRREALPLILLEAGIARKAVIASKVGGIPEVIIDGETGLLVSPEDPEELASAILQLVRDPQLAGKMGGKANKRVKRVFSPQRYYTEFLELYASLLEKKANPFRP